MWFFVESGSETLPSAVVDIEFGSVMPSGMVLERAGTAMGRDASGEWVQFATNTPRTWFDPATLDGPFLLVEPSRTQILYRTRQPTPYSTQATIGYDAAIETPFGAGSATIIPNTVSGTHGWASYLGNVAHGAAIADNTTLAIQAVMKPIGVYKEVAFFILNRTNTYTTCRFALDGAGTVVSQGGVISAEITPDANGFYLIKIVNNFGTGTTGPAITANIYSATGARTHAGDGTSGMYLAYFGAEIGTEVTSPIINSGVTTVTRPGDVVTSTLDWVTTGAKSIGIDYVPMARTQQAILHLTGTDSLTLTNSLPTITYNTTTGTNPAVSITATDPKPGKRRTIVLTAGQNGFLLMQDGDLLGSQTGNNSPSSFTIFRLGAQTNGSLSGPVLFRRIKYWDESLSLQSAKTFSSNLSIQGDETALPVLDLQPTLTVLPEDNLIELPVTLSGMPEGASVNYKTIDGNAIAGVDYVGASGTVSIDSGEVSATLSITLNTRGTVEDKSFSIELSAPKGARIGNGTCVVYLPRVIPAGVPSSTQLNFGSTLPTGVVHTRASIAWTRNNVGNWTQVAVDGYRQHFTAPGISGMLMEPAAAEQRLYDSVNPGWAATNGTITTITNEQTPTGLRYIRYRETATTGEHNIAVTLTSANCDMPTGEFTTSIMIRPIFRPYIRLTIKGIDNVTNVAHLNLNDPPAITTIDSGIVLTIEKDPFYGGSGWHRISFDRGQVTSAGVSATITIAVEDASQAVSFGGVTSDGFDLCHIQLENGAGMSSPIIVQGASAKTTRAADVLKASGTWWQLNTYSLAMRFIRLRDAPNIQRLWIAKDTANSSTADDNGITTVGGLITANLRTGSVNHAVITGPASPIGTASTVLMTVNPNARIAVYSGGAKMGEQVVGITGAPSPVAVAALRFGATEPSGLQPGSIVIQAIYSWTSPLSESDSLLVSGNLNYSPPSGAQPLPVVSVPKSMTVTEGATLTVPITKTGTGACSVQFYTKESTAKFATDYNGIGPITVNFAANDTVKTLDVVTISDLVDEAPGETFTLNLQNPVGCTIGPGPGIATILEPTTAPPSSYPTAVGFASAADCGIGQPVYKVTNLSDSGAGSLREGVTGGNQLIVFEIAGKIVLLSDLTFNGSNVTVAGETAPAPGITIQKKEFKIHASNIRISHITFQKGYAADNLGNSDVGKVSPGNSATADTVPITRSNIHFYHCAFYWNMDESIEHWPWGTRRIDKISYHDCIFTEALDHPKDFDDSLSNHVKVKPSKDATQDHHNYGMILGYGVTNFDIQNCLFSEFAWRCPRIDHSNSGVIANNIASNCGNAASLQQSTNAKKITITIKGYLCISGPNTGNGPYGPVRWNSYPQVQPADSKVYAGNLYGWKGGPTTSTYITPQTTVIYDNLWTTPTPVVFEGIRGKPFWLNGTTKFGVMVDTPPIEPPTATVALTAQEIYDRALANVGPRPKEVRSLDQAIPRCKDLVRTVTRLKNKTGKWVNHENETDIGGFYNAPTVRRVLDANTTFDDNTKPGPIPTATDKVAIRAWLRKFLNQVQLD